MRNPLELLPRPLDPLRSFKAKVALLVGFSLLAASLSFWIGAGWPFRYALVVALVVALAVTQLLAHGMTSPLREMTAASRAMATGDYSTRVTASSADEIGELARAFNRMAEDLQAADGHRRELIGNVSHELRTPIAGLRAVLENVVDGVVPPSEETMRTALRQTERLGRLVDELLDLARLEGGATSLNMEAIEVDGFLRDVVAQGPAPHARIDVDPPDLRATADPARLHQVIANLLDNAVRHGPPGQEVDVSARASDEVLVLEVRDRGPGIPQAERTRVFQRFTRGGAADGGTGLGLAIARWAVELHGGTIEVADAGPGCCMRVTLPRA